MKEYIYMCCCSGERKPISCILCLIGIRKRSASLAPFSAPLSFDQKEKKWLNELQTSGDEVGGTGLMD